MAPFYKIQIRRGTTNEWTLSDPTLDVGEMGYDTNLRRIKVGNGLDPWSDLAFADVGPPQVVSSGGIADLTSQQQDAIATGTVVTTSDGRRWVYGGLGIKTLEASYIELADITPEWLAIANRPETFPPSAHSASHRKGGFDQVANVAAFIPLTGSTVDNLTLPTTADVVRLTSPGSFTLNGITAQADGTTILLYNSNGTLGNDITLPHLSASALSVNRFYVPWGGSYVMPANGGAAVLVYDGTAANWRVV
jgi:hypothetical protein